jgi:hypothetical protein
MARKTFIKRSRKSHGFAGGGEDGQDKSARRCHVAQLLVLGIGLLLSRCNPTRLLSLARFLHACHGGTLISPLDVANISTKTANDHIKLFILKKIQNHNL